MGRARHCLIGMAEILVQRPVDEAGCAGMWIIRVAGDDLERAGQLSPD